MKLLLIVMLSIASFAEKGWQTDYDTARKMATEKGRYILLNFSGSDWCIPCIRLRKEIFETDEFLKFADSSLVLLNADFPRSKKNQLSKEAQQKNDALAEKFNGAGQFPLTVLLTADGKVVHSWEGYPSNTNGSFIQQLKSLCDAYHP